MKKIGTVVVWMLSFALVGCASLRKNVSRHSPRMDEKVAGDAIGVEPQKVSSLNDKTVWLYKAGYLPFYEHKLSHYGLAQSHMLYEVAVDTTAVKNRPEDVKVAPRSGAKSFVWMIRDIDSRPTWFTADNASARTPTFRQK